MTALLKSQITGDRFAEAEAIAVVARRYAHQPKVMSYTSLLTSFLARVAFGMADDCWYWIGGICALGYGLTGNKKRYGESRAHRVAWTIWHGPVPAGLKVCHRCDVRRCVNPDHLFLGTQADNVRDMVNKGRRNVRPMPGEKNGMSRLTSIQVEEIRAEYAAGGISMRNLARKFDVSTMAICRVVNNQSWRA